MSVPSVFENSDHTPDMLYSLQKQNPFHPLSEQQLPPEHPRWQLLYPHHTDHLCLQDLNRICQYLTLNPYFTSILLFCLFLVKNYLAVGSLNELFNETILLNTGCPSFESLQSAQKKPFLTNWKLS